MEGHAGARWLNHADIRHFSLHAEFFGSELVGHIAAGGSLAQAELLTLTARTVIYLAGLDTARPAVNTGIGAKCGK